MRLDVGYLVTGRDRDRLQRADLVGDQIFDLGGPHAWKRPSAKAVQVAVTGMRADTDAARFCKLHGPAHDVGIAGMEAAGDVDRGSKLDHGGVIAHLPCAKSFAEIAIEIDCCHVYVPLARVDLWLVLRQRICRWDLPCSGIDRADGSASDISILQRLDVEIESLDRPDAIGQAAQQLRKLAG